MKDYGACVCRVCGRHVIPWRRGWRRPHTTIHESCLTSVCRWCGVSFTVKKECKGLFCCDAHQQAFRRQSPEMATDVAGTP